MMKPYKFFLVLSTAAALTAGLTAACTPVVNQRGNMLETSQLEQVTPGESTRSDVLKILGSPTTKAPFDDNTWYYIGQETEKHGILDPEVVKERIIVVTFAEDGIVDTIREDADGRVDVPIAKDKTPTHGNEVTIMQQFLGNLGRFNPQE